MISLRFRKLYLWIQRIRWAADDQRVTITVFWCKFGVDEWCSLEVQMVKCLPAMRETWVWSLSWEDPLEKEMATHSTNFVWKIPWTEEPCRLQSKGSQRVRQDWVTNTHTGASQSSHWAAHRQLSYCYTLVKNQLAVVAESKRRQHFKMIFFWFLVCSWSLSSFFTFSVFSICWATIEWSMLSLWATSHVVVRGSASIIFSIGCCRLPMAHHCTPRL